MILFTFFFPVGKEPKAEGERKIYLYIEGNVWLLYKNQSIKSNQASNNFHNVSKRLEYHKGVHQSKTLKEVSKEAYFSLTGVKDIAVLIWQVSVTCLQVLLNGRSI